MAQPPFEIIDGQVGIWEAPSDRYPWAAAPPTADAELRVRNHMLERTNSIVETCSAMAAVGVDSAVLNQSAQYGDDLSYVLDAARLHPQKFASMPRMKPGMPDLAERIRTWRDQPGVLGGRVVLLTESNVSEFRSGVFEELFRVAAMYAIPVYLFCPHLLAEVGAVARRHERLTLVIDHLGLPQPPLMNPDPDPFQALPDLLALARYQNVSVKLSGAPALSKEAFPFRDIRPAVLRVIEAFGPGRVMWASDYARVRNHTYAEALGFLLYSDDLSWDDKAAILGGNARRLLRWPKE